MAAISFKEISRNTESLLELGKQAEARVKACQARVLSCINDYEDSKIALEEASIPDDDGYPRGDISDAQASVSAALRALESSKKDFDSAKANLESINSKKESQVSEIEDYSRIEKANLEKLKQLQNLAFAENSKQSYEGIVSNVNAAEDARLSLLESLGKKAMPDYVNSSSGSSIDFSFEGSSGFDSQSVSTGEFSAGGPIPSVGAGLGSVGNPFSTMTSDSFFEESVNNSTDLFSSEDTVHSNSINKNFSVEKTGHLYDFELSYKDKIAWIQQVVSGCSESEAMDIVNSAEYYSGNGYKEIHRDSQAKLPDTQRILRIFDNNRVGVFDGTIYRGLSFDTKEKILSLLSNSIAFSWKEPGITSFSSDLGCAEEFANQKEWGLVLRCNNNKTAIPFRHMSKMSWECEVLSPGGILNKGWTVDEKSIRIDNERKCVYADIFEN